MNSELLSHFVSPELVEGPIPTLTRLSLPKAHFLFLPSALNPLPPALSPMSYQL